MRHYFIVNPTSGPSDCTPQIKKALAGFEDQFDYEIYVTTSAGDATRFVRKKCESSTEPMRFYACGGDGTLNEVVNGAALHKHAAVGCFPCGSGNDFVKYYGGKQYFSDIGAVLAGKAQAIDVIRVNDKYCINVANAGFESKAADRMARFRRFSFFKNQRAYYPAIVMTLFDGMHNKCRITADDEVIFDGDMLLCTMANGSFEGGGFCAAPRADVCDGLMDVCAVKSLSILKVPKAIGIYQKGGHLDSDYLKPYVTYRRARRITVEGEGEFLMALDGEIHSNTRFDLELIPGGVNFIVPHGAVHAGDEDVTPATEQAV
ncbi:MAG: YegS/Rv2252/BmrU family lipid kinase [Clostridia bacterium]|nr:YegS/Rv2252/BmrU family lipid kinase [Clostridia bacterium]